MKVLRAPESCECKFSAVGKCKRSRYKTVFTNAVETKTGEKFFSPSSKLRRKTNPEKGELQFILEGLISLLLTLSK